MDKRIYKIEEIKKNLHPIFKNYPIYKAVLFGSYAKGIANEHSDIDIVIDSRGELLNIEFFGVLEDITEKLNKKIDLFEIAEIRKNTDISDLIDKEGYTIYEH